MAAINPELIDLELLQADEAYLDALDYLEEKLDANNDEEIFGGYGSHFDCYSTFDADDFEYLQGGY